METITGRNLKIGDVLIEQGYLTRQALEEALEFQKDGNGKRLGEMLIEQGYITENQMLQAMATKMECQVVKLESLTIDINAVDMIPRQMAEKYCMLAVGMLNGRLQVVVNDPLNFYALEDVRQITGQELAILLSEKVPLQKAIRYFYSEISAKQAATKVNETTQTVVEEIEVEEGDDDTPIINLLSSLIQRAYSAGASDIHIEPFEDKTIVRMRVDGTIVEYVTLKVNVHNSLIARIKILSELDIAERRRPQDGHFKVKQPDGYLNIRVSVIPTVFGEKAVLRLLSGNARIDNSATMGMLEDDFEKLQKMLKSPNGIIYLTGPTGSGKTTTLYMILEELSARQVNISTIEDPVEKNLPKVNQMQVNPLAGLTFESGLRALLRQDPDIIMVGETRDAETASISVRSALTGHLVFSTLHTNDAASSAIRLKDMGLEPYLIANSMVGVVAQRLMRKVCPECADTVVLTPEEQEFAGGDITIAKKACGCSACNHTGYKGRVAVHEILQIDKEVRRLITENAAVEEIKDYALKHQKMRTLKQCALTYLKSGITTMEEVLRVAYYEE
ncbi:MAG: Flp pilus assembly complex ATPase component TadA [Lachnospiraceae bacterium]|nr:Flp pilus assembly complex ATPase component TadA [Lachnospiraceae bacterium]